MSATSPAVGKTFVCTEASCEKSFVRAEHLARHRLNRKSDLKIRDDEASTTDENEDRPDKIYSCPRCPKEFVRPDLYQRHKARHEKGMWYRQVGGVVEKSVQRSPNRKHPSAQREAHTSTPESSPPEERSPQILLHRTIREEYQCPVESQYEANNSFGVQNYTQNSHRIQGSPSVHSHDVAETLFFDDSANFQDLPEDLDWFFETSQPGLFSTASQRINKFDKRTVWVVTNGIGESCP
jgi:hypothetical protein